MKKIISLIFLLVPVLLRAQQKEVDYRIVNGDYLRLSYMEMPFMVNELIEIYKRDTTIISKNFNYAFDVNANPSLRRGFACLHNMAANALKDSLLCIKNSSNQYQIDKIISEIKCSTPHPEGIDWGRVYVGCENSIDCPFTDFAVGSDPDAKSSMIYMTEKEICEMIKFENGEQWRYMLIGISLGDVFSGVTSTDPIRREIDRRIMQFLIDKWSPCQIPEVQELVKVLKESMPLEELANPVDVITGTWRGAFGNKTINFTIDYDASIAEAEKEYAKQTRWGMFINCYFGVLGKSLFDGQPESKSVQSKGYYTDGGKAVQINLIEQPDTAQWNGEFNIWIDRKTNKMHGTWESNNKKLKRDFELEKVE